MLYTGWHPANNIIPGVIWKVHCKWNDLWKCFVVDFNTQLTRSNMTHFCLDNRLHFSPRGHLCGQLWELQPWNNKHAAHIPGDRQQTNITASKHLGLKLGASKSSLYLSHSLILLVQLWVWFCQMGWQFLFVQRQRSYFQEHWMNVRRSFYLNFDFVSSVLWWDNISKRSKL